MRKRILALAVLAGLVFAMGPIRAEDDEPEGPGPTTVNKNGFEIDERSIGRILADETLSSGGYLLIDLPPTTSHPFPFRFPLFRRGNTQVNDPALDNIQVFNGFRPFIDYTQSETSVAAFGSDIVATYNTSANQPLVQVSPGVLQFVHRFLSGYSVSHDGGKTWKSGFMPPVPGSVFTFGDPSIDVDRHGNFFFAGLGANADGDSTVQVNRSTDGGRTWSDAVVVQQDDASDKEWLAVGRDPVKKNRDNVYVTWTSFQDTGAELRFGRSFDGGVTWQTKTIFTSAANADPTMPQDSLQFSTPTVDPITGTLYVPFVQFSNSDTDFIRVLKSEDAGTTFSFVQFNIAGAPLPDVVPIVQSGELLDMGSGGVRLGLHAGPALPGRFGLRQFVQTTRLITQPSFAARGGRLYLAWSNSTGTTFGDPTAGSNMLMMYSKNGGATWSDPTRVNPKVATDVHHVMGSLTLDTDADSVHVAYYTQHDDETIDVDVSNSLPIVPLFPKLLTMRLTNSSFALPPTVIRLTAAPTPTTNYDRLIQPGYSLGEYMSLTSANGFLHALWGDARNSVTHPVNALDPLSGQTHPQQDVFYQKILMP